MAVDRVGVDANVKFDDTRLDSGPNYSTLFTDSVCTIVTGQQEAHGAMQIAAPLKFAISADSV